jgi:hypothetical protein
MHETHFPGGNVLAYFAAASLINKIEFTALISVVNVVGLFFSKQMQGSI